MCIRIYYVYTASFVPFCVRSLERGPTLCGAQELIIRGTISVVGSGQRGTKKKIDDKKSTETVRGVLYHFGRG